MIKKENDPLNNAVTAYPSPAAAASTQSAPVSLEWESPSRVFKKRDSDYLSRIIFTVLGIGLFLIFFKEFILLTVILALAFVAYVLGTIPPEKIEHKITPHGVTTAGHSYIWAELRDFWFTEKNGTTTLYIRTNLRYPPVLALILGHVKRNDITHFLAQRIFYRETPRSTVFEQATDWAAARLNLH